jgi:PAS domain S-box-containing protein
MDAVITTDENQRIVIFNAAAEKMFGCPASEALGQPLERFVPMRFREAHAEQVRFFGATGGTSRTMGRLGTIRGLRANGEEIPLETSISHVECGGKKLFTAILRDISERQRSEEMFRKAVESAPSGILMIDEHSRMVLVNDEAERLFGYMRDEMVGQTVEMLIPVRFRSAHPGHREAYRDSPSKRGMGQGRDLYGLRKDGTEFPVEVGLNPVATREGMQVLVAVVDITERKRAEREAEEHTRELQRSNAELEQFAYIASHDLQEPLRMVASYTELLAERYQGKLDANADKFIGYAVDGARRMQRLIHDLLSYARVSSQAKPLQATDASTVLTSVLTLMSKSIESSKAEVICQKLPTVMADEVQLGQLFQNLINNALKFHGEKPPRVEIGARVAGDTWQFSVTDNGIGMEKENGSRIFQMFQRLHTREEYEGTGIGLAISKRIVERHGGRIWFDSKPGQGSTFYFTLLRAEKGKYEQAYSSASSGR